MDAASPVAGETCAVSVKAHVFLYNSHEQKWNSLGDRALSRVQVFKRRQGEQAFYRIVARCENAPANTPPILMEQLDPHSELLCTTDKFYQLQLGSNHIYGLNFTLETDAQVFSTFVQSLLMPTTPTTPERRIEDELPPAQLGPRRQRPQQQVGNVAPFSTMQGYSQRERIPANALHSVPPVHSKPMIETYTEQLGDAIAKGDVGVAQSIVAELAKKKANVNVEVDLHQKPPEPQLHRLRVMVEDRETPGGSFTIETKLTVSIKTLKQKVYEQHQFPVEVQRWFFNRRILKDNENLRQLNINPREHVLNLYLLSSKSVDITREQVEQRQQRQVEQHQQHGIPQQHNQPSLAVRDGTNIAGGEFPTPYLPPKEHAAFQQHPQESFRQAPETPRQRLRYPLELPGEIIEHQEPQRRMPVGVQQQPAVFGQIAHELTQRKQAGNQHNILPPPPPPPPPKPVGWSCAMCTFLNKPTRPGCEMCGADRPQDYVVPANYQLTADEQRRIQEEQHQRQLVMQAEETQKRQQKEERRKNLQRWMKAADTDLITNEEDFECPICFLGVEPGEGVVLRECLHQFCKQCLAEHVKSSQEADVRCPYMDDEFACDAPLTEREIKQLLDDYNFHKWHERGIAIAETQMENAFHCKTVDCHGWCVYDDDVNDFDCPVCKKRNCLLCKAIHYPEMNCKEYQEDLQRRAANDEAAKATQIMLERMVQQGDAMYCPKCRIIVQKKDGCDWIRCSMCKTEICWATKGPRWGPKGKGDTSGGCKCGIKGRCHPNCRNCH